MKKKYLFIFILIFISGLVFCSPLVYPRAGSGQKYRPPSRPSYSRPSSSSHSSSSSKPSYSYTPKQQPRNDYTPSNTYNNSGYTRNTYNNKSYHNDYNNQRNYNYNPPVNQPPVQSRPSGGCCCAPCGIFGITIAAAFLSMLVLIIVVL